MKSFTVCSFLLLLGMAATSPLTPSPSTGDTMDNDELEKIIEELASKPEYEGPYEVDGTLDDDSQALALSNDTDETDGVGKRSKRWANGFDSFLYFICPNYDTISRISSYHSNPHEDRRFSISCKRTFSSYPRCTSSGWVNNFDQTFTYTCPSNYAMAGITSYHNNNYEDRRFNFRCCGASGHRHYYCYWTYYMNNFDGYLSWTANSRSFLAGVSSYHNNNYEDRRFRFYICVK